MEIDKSKTPTSDRLDQIEAHLRVLKTSDALNARKLDNIETALIGNDMNGHQGLVSDFKLLKETQKAHESDISILQTNLTTALFWGKLLATAFIVCIVGILLKK